MHYFSGKLLIAAIALISVMNMSLYSQSAGEYDFRDADKLLNEEKWDDALAAFKFLAEKNV